jgi:hypothetical protein
VDLAGATDRDLLEQGIEDPEVVGVSAPGDVGAANEEPEGVAAVDRRDEAWKQVVESLAVGDKECLPNPDPEAGRDLPGRLGNAAHLAGIQHVDSELLQPFNVRSLVTEACLELVDVAELGVTRPHSVKAPRGQGGVEVIEERVVSERIYCGWVASQGLDRLQVKVDAWSAKLPVGVEAADEAAEVTYERFEDGTAFVDSFLEGPALSCAQESAIPHPPE